MADELGVVVREYNDVRQRYKRLKQRKRALEQDAYGALGPCFGRLPRELLWAVLDWEFMGALRAGEDARRVFVFFQLCRAAAEERNAWCVHAYRALGGLEDLTDGWAWMQRYLVCLTRSLKEKETRLLGLGICSAAGKLPLQPHPDWESGDIDLFLSTPTRTEFLLPPMRGTALYVLRHPETPRKRMLRAYILTGMDAEMPRQEWRQVIESLDFYTVADVLGGHEQYHALLLQLGDTPARWAYLFVGAVACSNVSLMVALLEKWPAGKFRCWRDLFTVGQPASQSFFRDSHKTRGVTRAFAEHAPRGLLDMPEVVGGEPGRAAFIVDNVALLMRCPHWQRVHLSGTYVVDVCHEVVFQRVQECGGRVHPDSILQHSRTAGDALPLVGLVARMEPSYGALQAGLRLAGKRLALYKALWAACGGRDSWLRLYSHLSDRSAIHKFLRGVLAVAQ